VRGDCTVAVAVLQWPCRRPGVFLALLHARKARLRWRKKLIMAGLVTDVCLSQSVLLLAALKVACDVLVSDCSGSVTPEAHEDRTARMVQAGARPVSLWSVLSEWTLD
jgi:nicotinamidase-related amidase